MMPPLDWPLDTIIVGTVTDMESSPGALVAPVLRARLLAPVVRVVRGVLPVGSLKINSYGRRIFIMVQ